jgi:hypothetical protein
MTPHPSVAPVRALVDVALRVNDLYKRIAFYVGVIGPDLIM